MRVGHPFNAAIYLSQFSVAATLPHPRASHVLIKRAGKREHQAKWPSYYFRVRRLSNEILSFRNYRERKREDYRETWSEKETDPNIEANVFYEYPRRPAFFFLIDHLIELANLFSAKIRCHLFHLKKKKKGWYVVEFRVKSSLKLSRKLSPTFAIWILSGSPGFYDVDDDVRWIWPVPVSRETSAVQTRWVNLGWHGDDQYECVYLSIKSRLRSAWSKARHNPAPPRVISFMTLYTSIYCLCVLFNNARPLNKVWRAHFDCKIKNLSAIDII